MPALIRFVIVNMAAGTAIGLVAGLALVLTNTLGFGDLVAASGAPLAATALIALSLGPPFGLGYLATALLLIDVE